MTVRAWFVVFASIVVSFGAGGAARAQVEELTPVTDAMLQDPDPADWLSWRRTLDGWGYSPLDEIDRGNVGELRLAWSWGMEPGVSQTTPLVHDGILYLANPGNVVQALHADSGDFIWEYRREMEEARRPAAQMRSLAIYEDLIILNTVDAHVVGLDARTGEVRWETPVIPEEEGYGFSSGPVIANGVVVAGLRGCERFREDTCYIVGLDARTGRGERVDGSRFPRAARDEPADAGDGEPRGHLPPGPVGRHPDPLAAEGAPLAPPVLQDREAVPAAVPVGERGVGAQGRQAQPRRQLGAPRLRGRRVRREDQRRQHEGDSHGRTSHLGMRTSDRNRLTVDGVMAPPPSGGSGRATTGADTGPPG